MELKDVTMETKIEECDFLMPKARRLCLYCSITTVGQLLDTPIEEVRAFNYGTKTINNLKQFINDVKGTIENKEKEHSDFTAIQTRFMFGKTYVKVLGGINNATKMVKWYESERWVRSDLVDFVLLYKDCVQDYVVFGIHGEGGDYYYILRVIGK